MRDSESRIPALDGVRGAACLMVIGHHYVTGIMPQLANTFLSAIETMSRPFMLSGVDLFFVLSGFLIGGILIDHRGSANYFRTFYIRRVCRIFPVYYVLLLSFVAAVVFSLPTTLPQLGLWLFKDPMPLISYATFTQNFPIAAAGHAGAKWLAITWSLAVEEQFYLLFPMIVYFSPPRALPKIAIAGILLALLFRLIALKFNWFASYVLLPCRMDTLMVGVLIAYLVRQPAAIAQFKSHMSAIKLVLISLVAVEVMDSFGRVSIGTMTFSLLAYIYGLVIIIVVVDTTSVLANVMSNQFLVFSGSISYALYMYHQAVNGLLHGFILNQEPAFNSWLDAAVAALSVLIAFALAYCSRVFLERPIRQYGKSFSY